MVTSGSVLAWAARIRTALPSLRGAQALECKGSGWLLSPSTHPPTQAPGISRAALHHTPQHCHLTEAGIVKPAKDLSWEVARAMGWGWEWGNRIISCSAPPWILVTDGGIRPPCAAPCDLPGLGGGISNHSPTTSTTTTTATTAQICLWGKHFPFALNCPLLGTAGEGAQRTCILRLGDRHCCQCHRTEEPHVSRGGGQSQCHHCYRPSSSFCRPL